MRHIHCTVSIVPPLMLKVYIRQTDEEGKQKWIPIGHYCPACGFIEFLPNYSPKKRKRG